MPRRPLLRAWSRWPGPTRGRRARPRRCARPRHRCEVGPPRAPALRREELLRRYRPNTPGAQRSPAGPSRQPASWRCAERARGWRRRPGTRCVPPGPPSPGPRATKSRALEPRVGGDQPLHALAHKGDGHFLVPLDHLAGDDDPVTKAPVPDPIAGTPGERSIPIGRWRCRCPASRPECAGSEVNVRLLITRRGRALTRRLEGASCAGWRGQIRQVDRTQRLVAGTTVWSAVAARHPVAPAVIDAAALPASPATPERNVLPFGGEQLVRQLGQESRGLAHGANSPP